MRFCEIIRADDEAILEARGGVFTVYHGTDGQFDKFDDAYKGSSHGKAPINMTGFNFTDSLECARTFGGRVIKVQVRIDRPRIIDAKGRSYSEFKHILNDRLAKTDPSKYDGIIVRNYADAGKYSEDYILSNHYIPFSSSQITVLGTVKE